MIGAAPAPPRYWPSGPRGPCGPCGPAGAWVRSFCAQQGLPYCEKSLACSYGYILRYLHAAGGGTLPVTAG